ncbi:MAG: response regulator [Dehalococcoidia bacterium]
MTVQTLILERNPLHRRLLIEFLRHQPGMALVGIAATLEEALALCRSRRPDLVMASLHPALRQGLETIRTLKQNLPQAQLLVLLDVDDERYRRAALDQGATYCVAKTALRGKLSAALERLQREGIASSSDRP